MLHKMMKKDTGRSDALVPWLWVTQRMYIYLTKLSASLIFFLILELGSQKAKIEKQISNYKHQENVRKTKFSLSLVAAQWQRWCSEIAEAVHWHSLRLKNSDPLDILLPYLKGNINACHNWEHEILNT